jgi:hypothetical protein
MQGHEHLTFGRVSHIHQDPNTGMRSATLIHVARTSAVVPITKQTEFRLHTLMSLNEDT